MSQMINSFSNYHNEPLLHYKREHLCQTLSDSSHQAHLSRPVFTLIQVARRPGCASAHQHLLVSTCRLSQYDPQPLSSLAMNFLNHLLVHQRYLHIQLSYFHKVLFQVRFLFLRWFRLVQFFVFLSLICFVIHHFLYSFILFFCGANTLFLLLRSYCIRLNTNIFPS